MTITRFILTKDVLMLPDQTILRFAAMFTWGFTSVFLWLGGPAMVNKILGFTPDLLTFVLLTPVAALVFALLVCLLIGLAMSHTGKQSSHADEQASRVADLYSSLTGNQKPEPLEYDLFYEPSPTKPSEIYREYDTMRAAIAAHVRAGDDTMTKAQQVKKYTELGGMPEDYLYQSPRRLRKIQERSSIRSERGSNR
jgi:hypothetical protein